MARAGGRENEPPNGAQKDLGALVGHTSVGPRKSGDWWLEVDGPHLPSSGIGHMAPFDRGGQSSPCTWFLAGDRGGAVEVSQS